MLMHGYVYLMCTCMHGIAHAQFCSRPRVLVIIPGIVLAGDGRNIW